MANRWTDAQMSAIRLKNKSLLISAAAGSGKTATLTERIVSSITDPGSDSDISKMLIVTYTKAAASELKERISSALTKALEADPANRKLTRQLLFLPSADISTIHSFCLRLIRPDFQRFSLPPNFRVGDDAELKLTKQNIMNELIDYYYEEARAKATYSGTFDFVRLADCLSGSSEDIRLPVLLISLYEKLSAYPRSIKLLDDFADRLDMCKDEDFLASPHGKVMLGKFIREMKHYSTILSSAVGEFEDDENLSKSYLTGFEHTLMKCRELIKIASSDSCTLDLLKKSVSEYVPLRLGSLKKEFQNERTDFYKKKRSEFADTLKELNQKLLSVSPEKIRESFVDTSFICRDIGVVLEDFERNYLDYKRLHGICDYNDLERYASQLLYNEDGSVSDIAKDFSSRYDEIYIDEYQDTNALQDTIFSAVARKDNRFMVGDIKQSIYKFRGAEPSIFASYRENFPVLGSDESCNEASIFMSNNFRCDETIIDFANIISRHMFYNSSGIPYNESDDLIFSKSPPHDGYCPSPVQIFILNKKRTISGEQTEILPFSSEEADEISTGEVSEEIQTEIDDSIEANFVAEQIAHLIKDGRKADGSRIRAGDIAILLRSPSSSAEKFKKALEIKDISSLSCAETGFFEKPEILLMLSLLCAIDNPTKDVYLAGVMMSPLFRFSMDELVELRRYASDTPLYYSMKSYAGLGTENDLLPEIKASDDSDDEEITETKIKTETNSDEEYEFIDTLREKCVKFIETLEIYRDNSRGLTTDKLIWYLLRDTGMLAILGGREAGRGGDSAESIKRSLMMFYEYARRFEGTSYKGLFNFIRYIIGIINENAKTDLSAESSENSDDTVTITSVHKSKGLEYPVCFLCGTSKKHNKDDLRKNLLFDYDLGVTVKIKQKGNGLVIYNTLLRQAAVQRASETQTEEEMRTLYVALTRARERLIVTAASPDADKLMTDMKMKSEFISEHSVYSASSYIDWILSAVLNEDSADEGAKCCDVRVIGADDDISLNYMHFAEIENRCDETPDEEKTVSEADEEAPVVSDEDEEMTEILKSRFSYRYPYSHLNVIPAKLTVSKLHEGMLDSNEDIPLEALSIDGSEASGDSTVSEMRECPRFMSVRTEEAATEKGELAAKSGTATHIFMQFCDFEETEAKGIDYELQKLINNAFISKDDASLINKRYIGRFFKSDIYRTIKNSRKLWREFRFNVYLPAPEFTKNHELAEALEGEEILVQGVIDCLMMDENGKYILIDYKTDYLTQDERDNPNLAAAKLKKRHSTQLEYYRKACEKMLGSKIDSVGIYSLPLGDCIWI